MSDSGKALLKDELGRKNENEMLQGRVDALERAKDEKTTEANVSAKTIEKLKTENKELREGVLKSVKERFKLQDRYDSEIAELNSKLNDVQTERDVVKGNFLAKGSFGSILCLSS